MYVCGLYIIDQYCGVKYIYISQVGHVELLVTDVSLVLHVFTTSH